MAQLDSALASRVVLVRFIVRPTAAAILSLSHRQFDALIIVLRACAYFESARPSVGSYGWIVFFFSSENTRFVLRLDRVAKPVKKTRARAGCAFSFLFPYILGVNEKSRAGSANRRSGVAVARADAVFFPFPYRDRAIRRHHVTYTTFVSLNNTSPRSTYYVRLRLCRIPGSIFDRPSVVAALFYRRRRRRRRRRIE